MTADQIEREAERRMGSLDRRLMNGELTQAEYDAKVSKLDDATEAAYRSIKVAAR